MNMEQFLMEVLKLFIPAAVVGFVVIYMLRQHFDNEDRKRRNDNKQGIRGTMLPLRLQAYERLTIYLERISVPQVILRVNTPGMSASELQREIISEVRTELEHNLSQQIYISHDIWASIVQAKEELISRVNAAASNLPAGASGSELGKSIIEMYMREEYPTSLKALLLLKKEVAEML